MGKSLVASPENVYRVATEGMDPKKLAKEVERLRKKMKKSAESLEFEDAAKIRDEVKRLQMVQLSLLDGDTDVANSAVLDGLPVEAATEFPRDSKQK